MPSVVSHTTVADGTDILVRHWTGKEAADSPWASVLLVHGLGEREYAGLTLPTLVLHGLDDGLVPAQASEILGTLPHVERRTYPGLRHELHNEPEGPAIVDEIIDWIRARTTGRATIPVQLNTASGERIAR